MPGREGDSEETGPRDLIIEHRNGALQRISELSSAYLPLRYPILFPHGEQGWHVNLHSIAPYLTQSFALTPFRDLQGPHKITQLQYYAFLLQDRPDIFNILLRAGRLSQEFIVDAYSQIEKARLDWIRFNQESLRVESYQDFIDARAEGLDLNEIGAPKVLPSSFIGGPRHMSKQYHDAMAVIRATSMPDLFITMTTNPNWPEILEECQRYNQTPQDRPDLVA